MSDIAIKVENLSKLYQLGEVGTGTISHDLNRWWAKVRGKEDPYAKVGRPNDRTKKGDSDFVWALKDINFEVKLGEVLGIIGRNGAGKSTLLKILSKITSPTTGRVYTKGKIASLLEVGTGFHPEMTGRENIYLNGAILGMRKWEIDKKFDEIVDFAGVEAYIDTPVKRYSSGMYVRLAFAVAAFLEPEILIVDEVLAVGDAEFQKKCLGRMKDVSVNDGRTVLFVSHNMEAVSVLTSSVVFLHQGQISFDGNTASGIRAYQMEGANGGWMYTASDESWPVYVKEASVITSESNGIHNFGKPLIFEFRIACSEKIRNATFSFQLFDAFNKAIVHAWVFDSQYEFCREKGEYLLKCEMPNPVLYLGRYFLTAHLTEGKNGRRFQTLERICEFEVNMHGIFREFDWVPNTCTYLEKFNWYVEKNI
jgi:lipopolysaccharide transport system ATP-binding protein